MNPTVTLVLAIFGAASPIIMLFITAILKRRADRAVADKTVAEARVALALEAKTEAEAVKTKQETAGMIIDHAARLVDEFREYQAEKDLLNAQRIAVSETETANLKARVTRMEDRWARILAIMATHGVWDEAAMFELKKHHSDYPAPPPLPESLED